MDFGLKFEVIKALQKALNEFLRIVGGGGTRIASASVSCG